MATANLVNSYRRLVLQHLFVPLYAAVSAWACRTPAVRRSRTGWKHDTFYWRILVGEPYRSRSLLFVRTPEPKVVTSFGSKYASNERGLSAPHQ